VSKGKNASAPLSIRQYPSGAGAKRVLSEVEAHNIQANGKED